MRGFVKQALAGHLCAGVRFPALLLTMISKKALIAGLVGLVFVAGGTASVLESFGTVSGTADVERPLEIEEIYYNSNVSNQESGEYVLLKNNQGSFDLSNWDLVSEGFSVALDYGQVSSDRIALVDNSSGEAEFSASASSSVKILEVGELADSGLSPSENIGINYTPENAKVDSLSYSDPGCMDSEAYSSSRSCEEAFLDVKEVSAK